MPNNLDVEFISVFLTWYWNCSITGLKSFILHCSIRAKHNSHPVACWSKLLSRIWFCVVAKFSDQNCRTILKSFPDLNIVTLAARSFQGYIVKVDRNSVIWMDSDLPLARGVVLVVLWIVWTPECPCQRCHCPCTLCWVKIANQN